MQIPLVSFVIPVLNGEKYIGRCLDSIQRQECSDGEYEVIVMDNGSTDRTLEIVGDFGFESLVVSNVNVATLRNHGARISRGGYLAFIDSDIELNSEFIEQGLLMFSNPVVIACGSFPTIPSPATWVQKAWNAHVCRRQGRTKPFMVSWLGSAVLMVRRESFLEIGGFNEKLETAEDVNLCYRLSDRGKIFCNPAMGAVHWGEPPDLQTFWQKEVWRGLGNFPGILSHGLRWEELPSIGYPVYVLIFVLLVCWGGVVDILAHQFLMLPIFLLFLISPPLILAGYTAWLSQHLKYVPQLFLIFLLYGLARAYALAKSLYSWKKEKWHC